MIVVIVTVCRACGLTLSEAKTDSTRLRTRGMADATATFSVETICQVYKQTHDFSYFGGNVNLSIEVDQCIRNVWRILCNYSLGTLELAKCSP